jgi:hypothetical protein
MLIACYSSSNMGGFMRYLLIAILSLSGLSVCQALPYDNNNIDYGYGPANQMVNNNPDQIQADYNADYERRKAALLERKQLEFDGVELDTKIRQYKLLQDAQLKIDQKRLDAYMASLDQNARNDAQFDRQAAPINMNYRLQSNYLNNVENTQEARYVRAAQLQQARSNALAQTCQRLMAPVVYNPYAPAFYNCMALMHNGQCMAMGYVTYCQQLNAKLEQQDNNRTFATNIAPLSATATAAWALKTVNDQEVDPWTGL